MLQCLTSHQRRCNPFSCHISLSTHFSSACPLLSSLILFCTAAGFHFASPPSVHVYYSFIFQCFFYYLLHPLPSDPSKCISVLYTHFCFVFWFFLVLFGPCFPFMTLFFFFLFFSPLLLPPQMARICAGSAGAPLQRSLMNLMGYSQDLYWR